MVQTRNSDNNNSDPIATQLAAIAAKLEAIETMKEDIAALKEGERPRGSRNTEGESSWRGRQPHKPYNKIDFPIFSSGDPRGWLLKAEKYFRYYQIPDEEKVEIASMHLEGDALDLYSWLSNGQFIFWEELVQAFTKNFGPAEFQNPDEFLCSIKQTGSVQEYRQEFAKRSSRVSNWPDHCLLGVFLNGLKDELKADVRIHKPRTVYSAMSLALEFESKLTTHRPGKSASWTPNSKPSQPDSKPTETFSLLPSTATAQKPTEGRLSDVEKQARYIRGECFRCGDKYGPGHRCKTGTFKFLEVADEGEGAAEDELEQTSELAKISLHALFADVVLGIQWLATLNTVQANWKEMFMKFTIDGKEYKLQGLPPNLQLSATFSHLTAEIVDLDNAGPAAQFPLTRLEDKSSLGAGCIDTNRVHAGLGQVRSNQAQLQVDRGKRGGGKSGGK
ncbi:retrotransposon gag domain, Retroviral aspartyl protease [Artemisia annua]|uniref:Retrotransposon gag domain, Retroviral aspartyl protease n=1 Tax=Artemisia annua TaxID=35608 RepID=A0A2U1NVG9_ARTAN|nr:retrotransposon gag domain, Retroviral aspartyl protease [Artemisia annua]